MAWASGSIVRYLDGIQISLPSRFFIARGTSTLKATSGGSETSGTHFLMGKSSKHWRNPKILEAETYYKSKHREAYAPSR